MCTRPALRAPPLRLPAFRALPPLMLMMRPQPAVFMNGMTAREQRSAPTYFHVEILQTILVDDGFDWACRGCGSPWRGAAVNEDVQAAQLLRRLGDHAVHL